MAPSAKFVDPIAKPVVQSMEGFNQMEMQSHNLSDIEEIKPLDWRGHGNLDMDEKSCQAALSMFPMSQDESSLIKNEGIDGYGHQPASPSRLMTISVNRGSTATITPGPG